MITQVIILILNYFLLLLSIVLKSILLLLEIFKHLLLGLSPTLRLVLHILFQVFLELLRLGEVLGSTTDAILLFNL